LTGTGIGTFFSKVLAHHGGIEKGILFDLPDVIEHAKRVDELGRSGIEPGRYEYHAGDFFKSETIPPYDAYMEKWVFHDWQDDKVIQILQNIHRAAAGHLRQAITNTTTIKPTNITRKPVTMYLVEMVLLDDSDLATNFIANSFDYYMVGTDRYADLTFLALSHCSSWLDSNLLTLNYIPILIWYLHLLIMRSLILTIGKHLPTFTLLYHDVWHSMQMHIFVGAKERTVNEYKYLLEQGGWELNHVHPVPNSPFSVIEATSQ
jgi:hypothetical protein